RRIEISREFLLRNRVVDLRHCLFSFTFVAALLRRSNRRSRFSMEMRSARGMTTYVHLRSLRRALQYNPCELAMSNSAFGQIGGNMSTRSGFTASLVVLGSIFATFFGVVEPAMAQEDLRSHRCHHGSLHQICRFSCRLHVSPQSMGGGGG